MTRVSHELVVVSGYTLNYCSHVVANSSTCIAHTTGIFSFKQGLDSLDYVELFLPKSNKRRQITLLVPLHSSLLLCLLPHHNLIP